MHRVSAAPNRSLLIIAFRGKVFGIERNTGRRVWRTEVDDTNYDTPIELAIGNGVVVACSLNRLSFVDYETGRLLGAVHREDSGRPTMLIDGDHLLVTGHGTISCYTLHGQPIWRDGLEGEGYGKLAIGFPDNVRQADG